MVIAVYARERGRALWYWRASFDTDLPKLALATACCLQDRGAEVSVRYSSEPAVAVLDEARLRRLAIASGA